MSRPGKIARLPLTLREQLNHRLQNGEPGEPLLTRLNSLPEVQAILKQQFASVPISKQNLHEWRSGGFREWELKRDLQYDAEETQAEGTELTSVTDVRLADHLAAVLAARYASLLRRWTGGEPTDEFRATLKVLHAFTQNVSLLRRWNHHALKASLTEARLKDQRHEITELKKQVKQQQAFIQVLEGLISATPATSPKPTSHTSPISHSSHPPKSPQPPPINPPVAASRQSAADSRESNQIKASQSTFPTPATPITFDESPPTHRGGDSLSPPNAEDPLNKSNPVKVSQTIFPTPLEMKIAA